MSNLKSREAKVRRHLAKDGYRLCKAPARHWTRREFGEPGYMIVDERNLVVSGCGQWEYQDTIEDVEAFAFEPID